MKLRNLVVLAVAVVMVTLALATPKVWKASAATLLVDDNNVQCPTATFATIQAAVNAAGPGDTIQVCAGNYIENVNIPLALSNLTLEGAQANQPHTERTFGDASESIVNGTITIHASDVIVNGFSITKTAGDFGVYGIHIQATGHGAIIINNIFDTIVNTTTTSNSFTAQAIYLQGGPDNVRVEDNKINNVASQGSAKGVLVGDNSGVSATNPSVGTIIDGNSISNVTSSRGAYGVSVARAGGTSHTGLEVRDNNISNLTGAWVHAIGLEGDTPGAIVEGNCFSNFSSTGIDKSAVFFEVNPGAATTEVHQNRFDLTAADFGIALHPTNQPAVSVDGENNWWGSPSGPTTPSNPGGTGAQVTPTVDYDPWLIAPPLGGACGGQEATDKDQCKNGGWATLFRANGTSFKNQGDCMQYVNTGK